MTLGHVLIPPCAALTLLPWVRAPWGLVAGVALALTVGNPYARRTRRWTRPLLAIAVCGLGGMMNLQTVASMGLQGLAYTAGTVLLCLPVGLLLARTLSVAPNAGLLITGGTAICGGSAIAALVPILRAREEDASVALATVFVLNAVGLFAFPVVGRALGLDQHQFGLWAALAIHDTSSVVGAASSYGTEALAVATTVKLARTLWIVPLAFAVAEWKRRGPKDADASVAPSPRPWFIAGFVGVAALVTFVPALQPAGALVSSAARRILVLTLFLIGANLGREALFAVGLRPLALGAVLWAIVALATLAGAATHFLG